MTAPTSQEASNGFFRPEALAQFGSPRHGDALLQAPTAGRWWPLAALTLVLGLAGVWSVFGRIPVEVTGRGVLVRPGKVIGFQAPAAGQLQSLSVREGDYVRKGAVLGIIDQASLRQQLDLERSKLLKLTAEYQGVETFQQQREALEKSVLDLRITDLEKRIKDTRALADHIRDTHLLALKRQRETMGKNVELTHDISAIAKFLHEQRKELQQRNATSKDEIMRSEQEYLQALTKEVEARGQVQQLDVRRAEVEDAYLEKADKVAQMRSQINEYHIQYKKLEQETLEMATSHKLSLDEVRRTIARLELEVDRQGKVVSEHSGRVLEITATVGQVLAPGARIGTIIEEDQSSPLVCLAYFTVKDGKRIGPQMRARVAPDPVQRERFGSLVGSVASVTPFPISKEAAVNTIGNSEVARSLTGQDRQMEMLAHLEMDPATASGYRWTSSRGPDAKMSAGTTATIQVAVEYRAPVTFVLPFLREWSGLRD